MRLFKKRCGYFGSINNNVPTSLSNFLFSMTGDCSNRNLKNSAIADVNKTYGIINKWVEELKEEE